MTFSEPLSQRGQMGHKFPCSASAASHHSTSPLVVGGFSLLSNSKYVNFHITKNLDPVGLCVWTGQKRAQPIKKGERGNGVYGVPAACRERVGHFPRSGMILIIPLQASALVLFH